MSLSYFAVFGAGLATFLSPCVLPLIPVLTANLIASVPTNRWSKFLSTAWFAIGFTLAFVLMGLGLSALVTMLPFARAAMFLLSGLVLGFFGLKMAGLIDRDSKIGVFAKSFQMPTFIRTLPGGLHGLFLGAGFGMSWTPCVGPILGGVLTYVATKEGSLSESILLLTSFSLGVVLPLLAAAYAADSFLPKLKRFSRFTPRVEAVAGYALVVFSIYLLTQANVKFLSESNEKIPVASGPSNSSESVVDSKDHKMLFFYSDNCSVCHAMESFLPAVVNECSSDAFQFVRVNVDRIENAGIAAKYNVRAVPTISVVSQNGEEVKRLIGYQTESRLRETASSVSPVSCLLPESSSNKDAPQLSEGATCSSGNSC